MTTTATSTGHALSASNWLETHYLAGQPEYEAMVRAAGFQPGWHVLDAGCGGGSFLPLLSELLGPAGCSRCADAARPASSTCWTCWPAPRCSPGRRAATR
ncbi:MAG: hypothetical protein M5U01_23770 [Ardenticatenaceae bacterium]|nr:hypothetical protein [Ardenticatenaceae bacterium]